MNGLIDFISTICPITGNDIVDTIIFAIITFIAFKAAWEITGLFSSDSDTMSFIHWIIRIVVFLALLIVVLAIINFIHWVSSWPWWVYLIIGIVLLHVLAAIVVVAALKNKKKKQTKEKKDCEE